MSHNDSYKRWHRPKSVFELYNADGSLKKGKTHEGFYVVRNKEKYSGDPNLVIYRSSWEYSFCKWCDYSPSILTWSSEPIQVPYYDKISKLKECKKLGLNPNNPHNWVIKHYNTDFWVEVRKADGTIEKWFIEIKPKSKMTKPDPIGENAPLRLQKKYNREAKEFIINEAKFEAMGEYARRTGSKFYVFTEDHLIRYGIIGGKFDLKPIDNKRDFTKK
jgi:hypothetical protein